MSFLTLNTDTYSASKYIHDNNYHITDCYITMLHVLEIATREEWFSFV